MPKVSQQHIDARRSQILDAAMECFAEHGIHTTTMRDIMGRSGLSAGAIYQYFKSKDDIVAAAGADRHTKELEAIAAAYTADGVQALRNLARTFLNTLNNQQERQNRRVGVQLWAEALRDPATLALIREGVNQPRARFIQLIRACQRRGELPSSLDPDAFARVMIALFQGLVLQQAWDDQVNIAAYAQTVETLLEGLVMLAGKTAADDVPQNHS